MGMTYYDVISYVTVIQIALTMTQVEALILSAWKPVTTTMLSSTNELKTLERIVEKPIQPTFM